MSCFEVVCIGEPQAGDWYAIPACLMRRLLSCETSVDELLVRFSLPMPVSAAPYDFIGLEDVEDGLTRYYPARPPVVFTVEADEIDSMRQRVREGEEPDAVLIEAYANGLIERSCVEEY